MDEKKCPKCGYMNHPDMEMCINCGHSMKGILGSLNLSSDSLEDKAINMMIKGNANVSKEELLRIFEEKAVRENISPELKQKIVDAISRSDFTGYKNPGQEKWEKQNIQKTRINLIIAGVLGLIIAASAIVVLLMTRVSTP
jgi:hypothetical protein